jgi:hypothetical protein
VAKTAKTTPMVRIALQMETPIIVMGDTGDFDLLV